MNFNLNAIMIGIATGVVAAILSVGSVVQNALSFVLFVLSPLPILLAGLGWGPLVGALSVVVCGLTIFSVAGSIPTLVILVTTAIPAALAAYFGGMARSMGDKSDWYPLGTILFVLSLTVAIGFVISGFAIGYNTAFVEEFSKEFAKQLASTNPELAANPAATQNFVNFLVASIPFLQPATWLLVIVGNVWLAFAIARRSGLFNRPKDSWPDALELPFVAVPLLCVAVIGAFVSASLGTIIAAFAGSLAMAFTITGFALVHAITRGKTWRPAALCLSYVSTLTFGAAPLFLFAGLFRSARHFAKADTNLTNDS